MDDQSLLYAFGHLEIEDVLKCQLVCQKWKEITLQSNLWRDLLFAFLEGIYNIQIKKKKDLNILDFDFQGGIYN